jgi:hypothetical protein
VALDDTPASDADLYRQRVIAEATEWVTRLHQGKRALVAFGGEQSPIDGGYYCLDVCEAIEQICHNQDVEIEQWRMDDIGMVFHKAA